MQQTPKYKHLHIVMKVWVKSLIGSLLALLGFQACDPATIFNGPDMYGPGPVEYGCPTAVFKFKGEATDEQGKPVPGIRIAVFPRGEEDEYSLRDTLFTGKDGKVDTVLTYSWPDTEGIVVKFEDVDGAENGLFKDKELKGEELKIEQTGEGSGNWYEGEFTITAKAVLEEINKKEGE